MPDVNTNQEGGKFALYTPEELAFRDKNYLLWVAFYQEAQKVRLAGARSHYSARTIAEVLRHNAAVRGDDPHFKINNNAIPIMARMYMKVFECPGFFETRNKEKQDGTSSGE